MKKIIVLLLVIPFFLCSYVNSNNREENVSSFQNNETNQNFAARPPIPISENAPGHMFRNERGHFIKDTPENRAYISSATSSPENLAGITKHGVQIYLQMMFDGFQSWAHVEDGVITNGGYNRFPLKWVANSEDRLGGRLLPVKYQQYHPSESEFKIRLQFNNLVDAYRSYHPKSPICRRRLHKAPTQGVENQIGRILNLFEDGEREHIFFLPTPEELLLKEEEIQQILSELATGIFFYDAVPFFSLHFTREQAQYPIIHPAYQNTLVGHTIALLDYHMKGFMNGLYFDEDFIQEWEKNPSLDKKFLKNHAIDLQEYCRKTLGLSYLTMLQWRKHFESHFQSALNIDYPQTSFRLIAKQNEIKRAGNLLVVGGDFDVFFALDYAEEQSMNDLQLDIETNACEQMCVQTVEIMPRLPLFKKHFQALSLINFFSYYFTTLKEAHKVPVLTPFRFSKNLKGCPSSFPSFPLDNTEKLETKILALLDSMPADEKEDVVKYIRMDPVPAQIEKQAIDAFSKALYQFSASLLPDSHAFLSSFDWNKASNNLLKLCKKIDKSLVKKMDATLVSLELKSSSGIITKEIVSRLIARLDSSLKTTQQDILNLENKIAMREQQKLPCLELLTKLANLKKLAAAFVKDKQMWNLWSQGSLIPSLNGFVVSLTTSPHGAKVYPEQFKGVPSIAGGCAIALVDKVAQYDPTSSSLLDQYKGSLEKLSPGKLLPIYNSWWSRTPLGVFFKIPFEEFQITNDEEKLQSLAYYHFAAPLNDLNIMAFDTVLNGNVAGFQEIANQILNWNFQDSLGVSVLHYAARQPNFAFLKILLERDIQLEVRDPQGYTALHHAAQNSCPTNLEMLLQKVPQLIDSVARNGETPLYTAAQHNQLACIQLLIKRGANPNLKTTMGMNPLMCAVYEGWEGIALELIDNSTIDFEQTLLDGSTVLHIAVESEMEKVVGRLCELGTNASRAKTNCYTPVGLAAAQKWTPGIKVILTKCPYVDFNSAKLNLK